MSEFKDKEFLQSLKSFLQTNISDLKQIDYYQFPEKPMFPIAILSISQINEREQDIDSARTNKYYNIVLNIEIFAKSTTTEKNKYFCCMTIKNEIIKKMKASVNFKNLILTLDKIIPNLDSQIARCRLTFEGIVSVDKNIIL